MINNSINRAVTVGNIIGFLIIGIVIKFILFSCANTTAPPMGGPKDTIPPLLLKTFPDSGTVKFPVRGGRIELQFDEYVALKEEMKRVYLSPATEKRPEIKIRGKSVIVDFPSTLDSSVTYTLNFGKSIVDNNESNQFAEYTFPFSTGITLDSMMCTGTVYNAFNLMPQENVTVAIYKDDSDSVLFKEKPSAISRTDKFGFFILRNIGHGPYKVYAFNDENNNNKYDADNERVAFLDSLIIPQTVIKNTLNEFMLIDEKDTLAALSRTSELNLYLFKEEPNMQYIKECKRHQSRMVYVKFSKQNSEVLSVNFKGIDSSSLKKEFNPARDSLVIWLTDTKSTKIPDTLNLLINYLKSDSLGILAPSTDTFLLPPLKIQKKTESKPSEISLPLKGESKRDDLLEFDITADPAMLEQEGFVLSFPAPLIKFEKDSVTLKYRTPKGDEGTVPYNVSHDTTYSRLLNIKFGERLRTGYEYSLKIKERAFTDIYNHTNDSIVKKASLPYDDRLATLTLDITGVNESYIVEITNITRDKTFRKNKINKDSKLVFPYLQPGKYSIKITQDLNGNGIIDTGSILERRQPEKVRLFKLSDGSTIITIPESSEIIQSIDINTIFNEKN